MIPPEIDWGRRALEHTNGLIDAAPFRGSATWMEARAAEHVRTSLTRLGVTDVRTQTFEGSRSIWFFLALSFGLAILGHGAYWLLRLPLGVGPALAISILSFAVSGYLLWRRFTFRDTPFLSILPRGPSQNVVAVLPPEVEVRERLVLIAHLDSQRAVWWFASDFLVSVYARLSRVAIYSVLLTPGLYAATSVLDIPALSWIGLGLGGVHFLAWFTGVTADLGVYSPGANDNAAAVGTALTLVERLRAQPLRYTEVWMAFTGCEETGCDGIRFFLDEYGERLSTAFFLDFELVGIGERLVYLASEGLVRTRRAPAEAAPLLADLENAFGLEPIHGNRYGVFTEMGVVWEYGYKGLCFLSLEGSSLLPQWHRLTDTPDRLEIDTLARVHELAWHVLHQHDRAGEPPC